MRLHKISRRDFLKAAGVTAAAMSLAACNGASSASAGTSTPASTSTGASSAAAGDAGAYTITIAHQQDEKDSMHLGAVKFKEYVEANSDGQITCTIYPNGQLGAEVDIIQSILSQGGCDITFTGETMQTYEPDLGMIGMPYLIQSDEHMNTVLEGEVGDELEGLMEKAGMKVLGYYVRGPRYITSNRKITCVADCKNLVIRTPAAAMTVAAFEAVGAKPTPMALNEVFTSLQQGTIEAQENPLAMIYTKSFYEVQDYLILTAHLRAWVYIAMGKAQFDAMPAELQQVVLDAAAEAQAYEHELFLDNEETYYADLQEGGMEFVEVDQQEFADAMIAGVMEVLTDSQKAMYEEIAALA